VRSQAVSPKPRGQLHPHLIVVSIVKPRPPGDNAPYDIGDAEHAVCHPAKEARPKVAHVPSSLI